MEVNKQKLLEAIFQCARDHAQNEGSFKAEIADLQTGLAKAFEFLTVDQVQAVTEAVADECLELQSWLETKNA